MRCELACGKHTYHYPQIVWCGRRTSTSKRLSSSAGMTMVAHSWSVKKFLSNIVSHFTLTCHQQMRLRTNAPEGLTWASDKLDCVTSLQSQTWHAVSDRAWCVFVCPSTGQGFHRVDKSEYRSIFWKLCWWHSCPKVRKIHPVRRAQRWPDHSPKFRKQRCTHTHPSLCSLFTLYTCQNGWSTSILSAVKYSHWDGYSLTYSPLDTCMGSPSSFTNCAFAVDEVAGG